MRRGDDERFFRGGHRAVKTAADARGAIDEHIIVTGRERIDDQPHRLRGNVFVRVRAVGGQNGEIGAFRVPYQRLRGAASPLDDVHNVVQNGALHAAHDVDVVESEIRVRKDHALPRRGEPQAEIDGDRRFSYPAFSGRDDDFPCQESAPRIEFQNISYHSFR